MVGIWSDGQHCEKWQTGINNDAELPKSVLAHEVKCIYGCGIGTKACVSGDIVHCKTRGKGKNTVVFNLEFKWNMFLVFNYLVQLILIESGMIFSGNKA